MRKSIAIAVLIGTISGCQIHLTSQVNIWTPKAVINLLTVLSGFAAWCLLTAGVAVHYCSSYKAQASWMMRAGASGFLLVMLFAGVNAAISSANQTEQNRCMWGVLQLLVSILFTWLLFRLFRPKPPLG